MPTSTWQTPSLNADSPNAAIAEWRRTVALKSDHAWAHFNLGIALRKGGQMAAAALEMAEAVRINPSIAGRTFLNLDAVNDLR